MTKEGVLSLKISSAGEFNRRTAAALEKVERYLAWPEEKLNKFMKAEMKKDQKLLLRNKFSAIVWERKK